MGFIQLVGSELCLFSLMYAVADITLSDSAGACIGFIFTSQSAPRYLKGIYYDIGVTIMSICFTCILVGPITYAYEWKKWTTDMLADVYCLDSQQEEKRGYLCRCVKPARAGRCQPALHVLLVISALLLSR